MTTRVRRESYGCTGRGFSAIDADGYCSRLFNWITRPNVHGTTQAVALDHTTNQFSCTGHGYVDGQMVVLTVSGGALPTEFTETISLAYPLSRLTFTDYFVIKVSDDIFKLATTHANAMAGTAIDFTSNGSGTISVTALGGGANWYLVDDYSRLTPKTFLKESINGYYNKINITSHGFSHGHKIVYSTIGTPISGLTSGQSYWVIRVDDNSFKLANSEVNAYTDTAKSLGVPYFHYNDVNVSTNQVQIAGHGITNASKCRLVTNGGTLPAELSEGVDYWVKVVDLNYIKFATSEANALANITIDLSTQGTGYTSLVLYDGSTHTITTAEHFVIVCDTASPAVNDYNTSPSGTAPKFLKIGYVNSESGYVRMQAYTWWNSTTRIGSGLWTGYHIITYDSAAFAYQFIGGDEFLFQASLTGTTWWYAFVDNFTGFSSKLEAATKIGILDGAVTSGSSKVLQLHAGEASNFTVNKYYYIFDYNDHTWVNYVKVTARDTVADTITVDAITYNFPDHSVISPFSHRQYSYGMVASGISLSASNILIYENYYATGAQQSIPYCSSATAAAVAHLPSYGTIRVVITKPLDNFLNIGKPDDEGYYDCLRHVISETNDANSSTTSMNRIYGKSNNLLRTARGTMGQMTHTRVLDGQDYLNFTSSSDTYVSMIRYSESAT